MGNCCNFISKMNRTFTNTFQDCFMDNGATEVVLRGLGGAGWRQIISKYNHDDVIKWKHFPRYWSFVRGIHRSPVNSPHKGQWRGALMFSLICAWINRWVNNRETGDLRRHHVHYDVIIMAQCQPCVYLLGCSIIHIYIHVYMCVCVCAVCVY